MEFLHKINLLFTGGGYLRIRFGSKTLEQCVFRNTQKIETSNATLENGPGIGCGVLLGVKIEKKPFLTGDVNKNNGSGQ